MKRLLILTLLLPVICSSQITTGKFGTYNWMAYIPANAPAKGPAIIFVPGSGESTTNVNDLYAYGPLGKIRDGWRPNFVVIGIQPTNGGPGNWKFTANALDSIISNPFFRVDRNRISLTGLSYGAATIYTYMRETPDDRYIAPASIVAFSYPLEAQCGNFYQKDDYLCKTDLRYLTVPVWGLCGSSDFPFFKQKRFVELLIQTGSYYRWTTYPGGHTGWSERYDPNYKEDGKNVYEWMLQYSAGGVLPVKLADFRSTQFGLIWSTLNENNTSHFIVECSGDGLHFEPVGRIEAKGNSQTKTNYTWQWGN